MTIYQSKISFTRFLVFGVVILLMYFVIYLIDFQFVKDLVPVESTNNLPERNIPQYINLYMKSILFICLTGIVSLILAFIAVPKKLLDKIFRKYLVYIAMVFFFSYILTFQILKFKSFHCYADLAVPLQVINNVVTGNGPISSLEESFHGSANWFSAHFSPVLYLVSMLFYLFPKVETILILQTLGFTLTSLPLYWYAHSILKGEVGSVLLTLTFLLFPPIHYMALYEFEYLKFAIPFLTFAFYFLYKKNYYLYFLFFFLSLCSREDVSLVTFALGIYIVFARKELKTGILTSGISIVYFVTLILYVMPLLRNEQSVFQFNQYSHLGKNFKEIFYTFFLNPFYIVQCLLSPTKIINFLLYTLPVIFSFFSPAVFFIALPNLLTSFLTGSNAHATIFMYHLAPTVPFLFFSCINGINNIASFFDNKCKYLLNTEHLFPGKDLNMRSGITSCTFALFVIGILLQYFFGPSPLSRQFWDKSYALVDFYTHNFHYSNYQINTHHSAASEIIVTIPSKAIISAEQPLLPHLYDRKKLYIFPDIKDDTEYVIIDKKHRVKTGVKGVMDFRERPQYYYDQIEKNPKEWNLIKEKDGVYLFKKCTTIADE